MDKVTEQDARAKAAKYEPKITKVIGMIESEIPEFKGKCRWDCRITSDGKLVCELCCQL